MALFVVLSDFSGPSTISAGSIIDSDAYDLPSLQASGLAVLPYQPMMDATIAAYLAQRGSAPSQAVKADLTAALASAGFIGGGGGGITGLTGFPPVATTVAGSSATVGLVPGSTPGDVLAWDGAAWVGTPLPASGGGIMVCLDNASPTTVSYETRGAVYLTSGLTLSALSAAYFARGGSSNTSYLRLTDSAEVTTFAEFVTPISASPGYAVAALDPAYVGASLAPGWYVVQVKYTSGGSSYASALGLYLTA